MEWNGIGMEDPCHELLPKCNLLMAMPSCVLVYSFQMRFTGISIVCLISAGKPRLWEHIRMPLEASSNEYSQFKDLIFVTYFYQNMTLGIDKNNLNEAVYRSTHGQCIRHI